MAKTFEDMFVWQKSHQFVMEIYKLTASFPRAETYGLVSQMRRAAVSIPANIAEGYAKRGLADKARMMNISQGSLSEMRYYLILTRDLGFISDPPFALLEEISKMLTAYISTLRESI